MQKDDEIIKSNKRLWNKTNKPVYSLSTNDSSGRVNMNICTYVTAVTLKPKKYMVAIEVGSKTHKNLDSNMEGLLQIFAKDQKHLINTLGKKSGNDINKLKRINEETSKYDSLTYLVDSNAFLYLKFEDRMLVGDHEIFVGKVGKYKTLNKKEILYTYDLMKAGLIL